MVTINAGKVKVTGYMGIIGCDLMINGGQVEFSSLGGIGTCYNVVLGVNKPTDYIKIGYNHSSISGYLKVADGLVLKDEDGNLYSGTLKEAGTYDDGSDMLRGKTLVPVTKTLTLPTEITGGTVTADKTEDVIVGKTVTLTVTPAEHYQVKSVTVNGGAVAVTDNNDGTYSFTMPDGDVTVSAEFEMIKTEVIINSVDINGISTPTTVYAETYTSADYTVPASPYLDGYTFTGWKVNDTLYTTADTVQTAVYDLVKAETPVTVEVVYEKKVGKHKVYVSAGTLENGETEFEYDISELVKITAYEGAEGQIFSYWERDGKAVSYNKTYSFYMPDGDVHLSAIYGNVQPAQATGFIENVTANADTRKISFVSVINVPENCTLVKGGLVATKNPDIGEAVTDKNAAFVKLSAKATADTKNLKYTWTKANVGENDIWYVRSYVVFIDTNNVEQTQYSDAVKADLSGRITG